MCTSRMIGLGTAELWIGATRLPQCCPPRRPQRARPAGGAQALPCPARPGLSRPGRTAARAAAAGAAAGGAMGIPRHGGARPRAAGGAAGGARWRGRGRRRRRRGGGGLRRRRRRRGWGWRRGGDGDGDEVNPLEAFMAGVHAKVEEEEKAPARSAAMVSERLEAEDRHESFAAQLAANRPVRRARLGRAPLPALARAQSTRSTAPLAAAATRKALPPLKPFATGHAKEFLQGRCAQSVGRAVYDEAAFARWAAARGDYLNALGINNAGGFAVPRRRRRPGRCARRWARRCLIASRKDCSTRRRPSSRPPRCHRAERARRALSGTHGRRQDGGFCAPLAVHVAAAHGAVARRCAPARRRRARASRELAAPSPLSCGGSEGARLCRQHRIWGCGQTAQYKGSKGVDAIVATPGRLIDVLRGKATDMQRVTLLVLDEATRCYRWASANR